MKTDSKAREAVLHAYDRAVANGLSRLDCYRAAVAAWLRMFPEAESAEARRAAVDIVVNERVAQELLPLRTIGG